MTVTSVPQPQEAASIEARLLRRLWDRLDAPPSAGAASAKGREVPGTLIIAAVGLVVGLIATAVAYQQDWILLYPDAQSHLVIARRVLDSQNTGFQQLGTVWLPVPHLLLLPFVQSFWLFSTGLAGSLLGTASLAVSVSALWRITTRVGFNRTARLVTIAVFMLNPAILYLTTTALTEPVLIAAILSALAGLSGWITAMPSISPGELAVFAGIPSALAVLTRYEGWAFVAVGSLFVIIAAWRRWRSKSYCLTLVLSYVAAPAAAVAWWLSYNYIRYGDPLDFARGQYSAAAQQEAFNNLGLLTSKGNLGTAVTTYNWSAQNAIGIPLLIIAAVGIVILIWERNTTTTGMLLWIPAFVYPFAILSLYLGQTIIENDVTLPPGFIFNTRYGAVTIPMVALMAGVVVNWAYTRRQSIGRAATAIVLAATVGFCAWSFADYSTRIGVIREGYRLENKGPGIEAARWLGEHYEGGYILIDDVANGVLIPMGVPLDQLYASFNGEGYDLALKDPYQYVDWVFANTANEGDRVTDAITKDPNFKARFFPVYQAGDFVVWENSRRIGPIQ
ncbi:MAG: hypothetical protein QG661_1705 [Actinomycetota bacterium]|jgi:hypothetical protein|nr:hypothetical protein [Actinomycetota bacterium]